MNNCLNCLYWNKIPLGDQGECRRFPPVPISSGHQIAFAFPQTKKDTYCGEHRQKESLNLFKIPND